MPTEKIKYSDNLKQGTDKLNSAIEAANAAETLSTNADTKATQALSNSVNTQEQLDTIVTEGDSSVEAAQARVPVEGTAYPTLKARLDAEYNGLTADLADIKYFGKYLNERLNSSSPVRIKLVGDSITAGQGATNYSTPSTNPVIFVDGSTTYYEASYNSPSWANLFRNFVLAKNPANEFYNWGIGGRYASWWNQRTDKFVEDEDIVVVMLGTNDRVNSTSLQNFKEQLLQFLSFLRSKSNYVVVMSANPNRTDQELPTNKFTQAQANDAIKQLCIENGYPFISHFDAFMKYSVDNSNYGDLLADGVHPNDSGHAFYWDTIQNELSLYDVAYQENKPAKATSVTPSNFDELAKLNAQGNLVVANTLMKNALFDKWSAGMPLEFVDNGCTYEQVPALRKGIYAVKTNVAVANGYFGLPLTVASTENDHVVAITYKSVGVTRFRVIQTGNTTPVVDMTLPEGEHVLEIPYTLLDGFTKTARLRFFPNVSQQVGGYLTLDSVIPLKASEKKSGYFTNDYRANVRNFGILGDGTNESTKVQAFVQHMNALTNSGAWTAFFPSGNYVYSSIQNLNTKIAIEGEGYGTVLSSFIVNSVNRNVRLTDSGMVHNDILLADNTNGKQYIWKVNNGTPFLQEKTY